MQTPSARERVVAAISELCAERGYEETTVAALIERAGVSEEEFAELFGGEKEEAILAAMNWVLGETVGVISAAYSADRSEWDSGILGTLAIMELMAANPSHAHLSYVAVRQMAPARVQAVYEAGIQTLAVMVERLADYPGSASPPTRAARGVIGGGEALVRREIAAGRTQQLPRLLPELVYIATVTYLGQEEALRLTRRARELLRGTPWG
jgi:AcrR family transcriptional regulator